MYACLQIFIVIKAGTAGSLLCDDVVKVFQAFGGHRRFRRDRKAQFEIPFVVFGNKRCTFVFSFHINTANVTQ